MGHVYWERPGQIAAAGIAANELGTLFGDISKQLGAIQVPPGVEANPQGKLAVVSRRLAQVGKAAKSQKPFLDNAARWAAIFDSTATGLMFPGPTPALTSPYANIDGDDHPGPDWLSGIVSPVNGLAKQWKGLLMLTTSPVTWVGENQETIRYGIANTGKLGRETWRDTYASDAADAGDRDYAWGQRAGGAALFVLAYARLASAGVKTGQAAKKLSGSRADELARRNDRNAIRNAPPTSRYGWRTGPDGRRQLTDLRAEHRRSLDAAQRALNDARVDVVFNGGLLGVQSWRLKKRGAGAAAATAGVVGGNPFTLDNAQKAQERDQGQAVRKPEEQKSAR